MLLICFQYMCGKCNRTGFKSNRTWKWHVKQCTYCDRCQSYKQKAHVEKCVKDGKSASKNKRFCHICRVFRSSGNFKRHMDLMHRGELAVDEVCSLPSDCVRLSSLS